MSITVTGATGPFGRLAIDVLLRCGIPASQIVAVGRNVTKIADLSGRGVTVRRADYDDPESLHAALAGTDRLLFVSGSELGHRVRQHQAVIAAAAEAGVGLLAYTSGPKAGISDMMLMKDHRATEHALIGSGLSYVFLRNGWYLENYTAMLPMILAHGLFGAAGDGLIGGVARADLAEAAAVVVAGEEPRNMVYELGGTPFTLTELAAEISRVSGREVGYTDLSPDAYASMLIAAGVSEPMATALAGTQRAAAKGDLFIEGDDLPRLLGRPATPLAAVIGAALHRPPARTSGRSPSSVPVQGLQLHARREPIAGAGVSPARTPSGTSPASSSASVRST